MLAHPTTIKRLPKPIRLLVHVSRSQADFISKITIVEEEADESGYWIELLDESGLMRKERLSDLLKEANELTAICTASGRTAKTNRK